MAPASMRWILAMFLACLLGATTADTAAAAEDPGRLMTEGGAYPAFLTSEQAPEERTAVNFTFAKLPLGKCNAITFTGTLTEASSTPTVHPEYKECSFFGLATSVVTTGCNYLVHLGGTIGANYDGTLDIECEAGKSIVVSLATCEVKIDAQTGLGTLEFVNMTGPPADVTAKLSLSKIAYTVTKDGIGCPFPGIGTYSDLDMTGNNTITAKSSGGTPLGLTVEMGAITP